MRTFAYFLAGAGVDQIEPLLIRGRSDPRFSGVRPWHVSTASSGPGGAAGLFMRPDPAHTLMFTRDEPHAGEHAYSWATTDEPGLWFGMARKVTADSPAEESKSDVA